jgi:hypothetical protein
MSQPDSVMNDATIAAATVAALAAVSVAVLAAYETRMRSRVALKEKAEVRRLETLERFMLAVNAWLDWLIFMEEQGWEGKVDELTSRVKARDDAYRQLLLLASDELYQWVQEIYSPLEYRMKQTYGHQVRWGKTPEADAVAIRREFSRLLRIDLLDRFRPEVATLRDPLSRRKRRRWRES